MLTNLHVKNLALIDETEISFEKGLNILTGETGAGKSIVLGSIRIALGSKVSADIIRKGADYALVELTFHVDSESRRNALAALDIEELDDGEVIITRKITPTRSQIKVNGQSFTAGQVRAVAALLIDIHGQHDNQLLLNESRHLEVIDAYKLEQTSRIKQQLKVAFDQYAQIRHKLSGLDADEESRKREISFLEFEVNEIEEAELKEGEDIQLESRFRKLVNMQKIMEDMAVIEHLVISGEQTIGDQMGTVMKSITAAASYDEQLQPLSDMLADIDSMISDASRSISDYIENSSFDEGDFISTQNRLDKINSLKAKYGKEISDIQAYCEKQQSRLDELINYEAVSENLKNQMMDAQEKVSKLCDQLSAARKQAADELNQKIIIALKDLNFEQVQFTAEFKKSASFSANGNDEMRFLISTNPGEDLKPLSKIASGGELSRIMLAMKTVIAGKDDIETLIFDEIDAGISGRTAQMTAKKLCQLSRNHQLICITHLPQIASMADTHFMIEKTSLLEHTTTRIYELKEEESITELARLLGGSEITQTVVNNAKEMRDLASKIKKEL